MTTRLGSIEEFSKNIDEIVSSPYVLSTVKISNLLKGVAASKILFELFDFCLKDFDYDAAFGEYFSKGVRGNGRFLMPPDPKTFIALAFSLLYRIDVKKVDLMNVLGNYFYAEDLDAAYKSFCVELIVPFKDQVLSTVKQMIEGENARPNANVSKKSGVALSDAELKKIDALLDQSKGVILQYKIEPKLKAELVALYDNFKQAIFDNDSEKLKVAFLGYKYAALYHRRLDVSVEKIEEILTKAGIVV
ncbi:MAG: hypothetical protein J6T42_02940 [Clostridia bacterium]|nr:hypothetical protein [Clostridia bacterium]